jgi:hypothetical protein
MASFLPPVIATLQAKTSDFTSGMAKARGEMDLTASKGSHAFSLLKTAGALAFAGIAGTAVAVGVSAVKAADTFDLAKAQLDRAVKNTGGSLKVYGKQLDDAVSHGTDFGFHVADTTDTLAAMTTGLGNTNEALKLLPLAEDIAKATGRDLASTGILVTKAYEGNTKALKQLGIDLPIASTNAAKLVTAQTAVKNAELAVALVEQKIHDGRLKGPAAADALAAATRNLTAKQQAVTAAQTAGSQITDALTAKYKGSAAAASDTFAGKQAIIGAKFDELKTKVGLAIEQGLVKLYDWYVKSGQPLIDRFDSGLQRWITDLGHVVHAIQDVINAAKTAYDFVSKVVGAVSGGIGSGGAGPNTPGGAPRPPGATGRPPAGTPGGPDGPPVPTPNAVAAHITINAGVGTDAHALQKAVVDALSQHCRQNGTLPPTIRVA